MTRSPLDSNAKTPVLTITLAETMGARARRRFEEYFSGDIIGEQYVHLYDAVISKAATSVIETASQ